MKKFLIVLAVLLLVCSVTTAQAYFKIADPKAADGASNVKIPVYNNSGGALDVGDVVVWQIGSATGDDDLYVTTTTTANTGLVAGVVGQTIATASVGSVITYGFAECDIDTAPLGPVVDGTLLCTSGVAGAGEPCSDMSQAYAIANATIAAGAQGNCFVIKNK